MGFISISYFNPNQITHTFTSLKNYIIFFDKSSLKSFYQLVLLLRVILLYNVKANLKRKLSFLIINSCTVRIKLYIVPLNYYYFLNFTIQFYIPFTLSLDFFFTFSRIYILNLLKFAYKFQ